jgi:hypothetical protein
MAIRQHSNVVLPDSGFYLMCSTAQELSRIRIKL